MPRIRFVMLVAVLAVALAGGSRPAFAQGDWQIERFDARITLEKDASITISESIDVDFGAIQKHGIYRDIPVRYEWNDRNERVYKLDVLGVTKTDGSRWTWVRETNGIYVRIKIGDADKTISGKQSYRISYRVRGALNTFPDHDELYWNVNGGDWEVGMRAVSAMVTLAGGGFTDSTCFQGGRGATEACTRTPGDEAIGFTATRPLQRGEQLTIVTAVRKGVLAEPPLYIEEKERTFAQFFDVKPGTLIPSLALLGGGIAAVLGAWWARGRDRRYTTLHYLTENPEEETRPLFAGDQVVVEFQPPERIRPGQMGVLRDERAETVDATATIVDLAVRGYLRITEIEAGTFFGKMFNKKDWRLTRLKSDTSALLTYEATILNGLFKDGDEVDLSDLKNKFYKTLATATKEMYADATKNGWFTMNPESSRTLWRVIAVAVIAAGAGLTFLLGRQFGAGLIGLPVIGGGVLLLIVAGAMARRSAKGSELLRRIRGFREYIATAETDRQKFNEQANIFAEYLPYAIVFGLVEKWANAFRDIDLSQATAGWYVGTHPGVFSAGDFSRGIAGFSSQVSSTIASTPGGSGSSGFGGGAGGGGGGGGGGSW